VIRAFFSFIFFTNFSKTKEENETAAVAAAAAAAALKSLGRVKKRPNLSLKILLNPMCRILKSLKKKSGPLETLLHTYLGTT